MLQIQWSKQVPKANSDRLLAVAVSRDDVAKIGGRFGVNVGAALTRTDFAGKASDRFQFSIDDGALTQVLLLGAEDLDTAEKLRVFAFEAGRAAHAMRVPALVLDLSSQLDKLGPSAARLIAEGLELSSYRYAAYLSEDKHKPSELREATVVADADPGEGSQRGQIIARAIARARDLGNGPAERVTPTYLAEHAKQLAEELTKAGHKVTCTVLDREACEQRNMGLYLAVGRGSEQPPKFIHMHYTPKAKSRGRVVLVGKGVTFDSGGYSLKPSDGMLMMKLDMGGAAAVIGAMEGIARLELEYEVHVISAAAENMVSGKAYRLGDVFRASNGKTVEINNTDAEGRLTLADALIYASKLEPDLVIDFATLTGACIVALGPHLAGVMTRDDTLADSWLAAAERSGEGMWRLPLPKPLMSMLDSKIADLRNTGERAGGALTAGLFLEQFIEGKRWMHVDIAGPAIVDKAFGVNREGASGFPVATILEFLSRDALPD